MSNLEGDRGNTSLRLIFVLGETTQTITIEVGGDNKKEASEYFYLNLFGLSSNAVFTRNRGIGTILNDDGSHCDLAKHRLRWSQRHW